MPRRSRAARLVLGTLVAVLSGTLLATPAHAATGYPIRNSGTHKCIDVATENNVWVQQWSCNGQSQQQWTMQWVTDISYWLVNTKTGRCLGLTDAVALPGARMAAVPCGWPSTYWSTTYVKYTTSTWRRQLWNNAANGLCLDLLDNNSANGTPIQLWWCWPNDPPGNPENNPAQVWLMSQ